MYLVVVRVLGVGQGLRRVCATDDVVVQRLARQHSLGDRLRQALVEVIRQVGRRQRGEAARREVVGILRIEASVVGVELGVTFPARIVRHAEARRPAAGKRVPGADAIERLLIPAHAGADGDTVACLPRVLREPRVVLLRGGQQVVRVAAVDAVDLPVHGVGNRPVDGARRRLPSIWHLEGRPGDPEGGGVGDILVYAPEAHLVRPEDVRGLDLVLEPLAGVITLVLADSAGHHVRDHGRVGKRPFVDGRFLFERGRGAREARLEEPPLAQDAVVAHRLVVAAVTVNRAEARRVRALERRRPLGAVGAVRRIAEEGRVEPVLCRCLVADLGGVPVGVTVLVDLAERREGETGRRHQLGALHRRVVGPEEEQAVLEDRPPDRESALSRPRTGRVDRPVRRSERGPRRLERFRSGVGEHASPELIRPALRDHVDDAAGRLAGLGLEPGGLDLDLLDEVERDPVAKRLERHGVRPGGAVAGFRDVHTVDDEVVLEAAAAGDRGVGGAGAAPAADAGRDVEDVGELPADREAVQRAAFKPRPRGGRGGVDDGGGRDHLDLLLKTTNRQHQRQLEALSQPNVDFLLLDRPEALQLGAHRVRAGRQIRRVEAAGLVSDVGSITLAG